MWVCYQCFVGFLCTVAQTELSEVQWSSGVWLQAVDQAQHMAGVECFEKVQYPEAAATSMEQPKHYVGT